MGNRAFITTHPYKPAKVGIYVHWNGGQESIEGFCRAAKEIGYRDPISDESYGLARLTQTIANFFGGELSVGIGTGRQLAGAADDQGIWAIGKDWKIEKHLTCSGQPVPLGALTAEQEKKAEDIRKTCVAKAKANETVKEDTA